MEIYMGIDQDSQHIQGRFTLWRKVKRLSISTNHIARNQQFGSLTLHNGGQNPKAVALQNAHMAIFFLTKATYCRRKFETNNNGNPNYGREVVGVHGQRGGLWAWPLEALYYARMKAPISIFYWLF